MGGSGGLFGPIGMLFGGGVPSPPQPKPPPPAPDPLDPNVLNAQRQMYAQQAAQGGGRQSTILESPGNFTQDQM